MTLVLYGPTATGKTNLAIKLAKKINGEIISADSRQVYKVLDIGSGKVDFHTKVKKHEGYWDVEGIRVYGFDLVKPEQQFNVADFLNFTLKCIAKIKKKNKTPIIVGGTGFYIKALIDGINSIGIPQDLKLRLKLEKFSTLKLFKKLKNVDPQKANSLNNSDKHNPRRLIRAIEIVLSAKSSPVSPKPQTLSSHYQIIGLTAPNDFLYKKVDKWLNERIKNGLIEEVQSLVSNGVDTEWLKRLGLEYLWITRIVTAEIDKNKGVERLRGDIHNFVRRQKTWFKKFNNIKIFDITKPDYQEKIEKMIQFHK